MQADASQRLALESGTFDAVICIDAINHLPDRRNVFADWARLLAPGGRLLFTDPLTVTGALGSDEIAIRTSIGYGLFVPRGVNEQLLTEAGLTVLEAEDTTTSKAEVARRRFDARALHEHELRETEGTATFEGRQRFFEMAGTLAAERRLSRFAYLAVKPLAEHEKRIRISGAPAGEEGHEAGYEGMRSG